MNVSSPAMKFAGQQMKAHNAGQNQAAYQHAAPQFGAQTQAAPMKAMNAAPAPTFGNNPKFGQKFNKMA